MFGKLSDSGRAKNRLCEKSPFFRAKSKYENDYMVVFKAQV